MLDSGEIITKAHIARDILANPDNQAVLKKHHQGKIPLQGEFIEQWIIKGCPAFVENKARLHADQAVDLIHQAGGIASCAHPSFNVMKGFSFDEMCQLILRNRLDAVEAINIQYGKNNGDKRFDMVKEFSEFADKNGLLITGGSDFHSDNYELWGEHTELGFSNEDIKFTDEMLAQLERHLSQS